MREKTAHRSESRVIEPLAYGIADSAKVLSISKSGIYRLIKQGKLTPVPIGGRRLIPRSQLLKLIELKAA